MAEPLEEQELLEYVFPEPVSKKPSVVLLLAEFAVRTLEFPAIQIPVPLLLFMVLPDKMFELPDK